MNVVEWFHGWYVHNRRVRVLAREIDALLPETSAVLDVGCGDGLLVRLIQDRRPDLAFRGIDVLVRPETQIPIDPFDGKQIPHPDDAFDCVMFVDVLHHSDDPLALLREAHRVARCHVVIKDHRMDGWLAGPTLRLMDHISNRRHGVVLPENYWRHAQWHDAFEQLELTVDVWRQQFGLYPFPASLVFGRGLHFLARLTTGP